MAEGTVRWYNSEEGHGVIVPDGGGRDMPVHYDQIQMRGYKYLDEGERVSFAVEDTPRGSRATKVTPLGTYGTVPPAREPGGLVSAGEMDPLSSPKTPQELFFAAAVWLAMPVCAIIGIILAIQGYQIAGIFFAVAVIAYFIARSGAAS